MLFDCFVVVVFFFFSFLKEKIIALFFICLGLGQRHLGRD